jgi:hypothetical protein
MDFIILYHRAAKSNLWIPSGILRNAKLFVQLLFELGALCSIIGRVSGSEWAG